MDVCSPHARQDDAAVVILGGRMSVTFTQRKNTTRRQGTAEVSRSGSSRDFASECYVNGLVDGDGMK